MSQRAFTRRSLLRGAAAAVPFLFPSRLWSAATPPSERLTLGFIGMGKQSRGLLKNFLGRETRVLAVCDVDTTRREDARAKVDRHYAEAGSGGGGGCAAAVRFEEVLGRSDIDAVVIATPDHWHAVIACAALAAGKDVYCEKPLTQTVHEALAVVAAAARHGRILQTGSMQRSMKEFRVACELVRNGIIGKVQRIECAFGPPGVPCDLPGESMEPGLDWDRWLGPALVRPYNSILSPRGLHDHFPRWRAYREFGGGMVTDWGAHHLDIAQWALGEDERGGPIEIVPPADWATAECGGQLLYPGGVPVVHDRGNGVVIRGTDGTVRVNRGKFQLDLKGVTRAKFMSREDVPSLEAQLIRVEKELLADAQVRLYRSQNHVDDFIECVRTRQQPVARAEIGARTVICCHLLNFGYYYGRRFRWDPAKAQFTGGTGDPAWLTRKYRGAWKLA